PAGSMLSIPLPEKELLPLLTPGVSLAAVNAPSLCVVSGPHDAIDTLEKQLSEKKLTSTRLHTSHAFHSTMMEPILTEFEREAAKITFNAPQTPYISNITGTWITVEKATDPGYWKEHLRKTVQFEKGLNEIAAEGPSIFIEVGPGTVLSTLVRKTIQRQPGHSVINLIRHPKENVSDEYTLMSKLGQLWLYGVKIDWTAFYEQEKRKRVQLPTYPFEGKRYWLEGETIAPEAGANTRELNAAEKKQDISQWFYAPLWEKSILTTNQN
ncbi:MAG: acyltransferase domain-containing protein, partial [bacterium]|nr:acyltransferase domain-containing protein [bacterium]